MKLSIESRNQVVSDIPSPRIHNIKNYFIRNMNILQRIVSLYSNFNFKANYSKSNLMTKSQMCKVDDLLANETGALIPVDAGNTNANSSSRQG